MAITYRGANNAAGQNNGTTTTAAQVPITPTLPASTAAGDRVFVFQVGSNTSGTTPAGWTVIGTKDTTLGSGTVAAGSGLRRATWYYRDYDGSWSMPAFTLASAAQNSHWIGAVSITPTAGSIFDTPTITTVGGAFNTAGTAYTDSSAASFTTTSGGFLLIGTGLNDLATASAESLTQSGATFASLTERCDGGTATGNDVAGTVHTASVTTGAAATITFTSTLSAASQGETLIVQQTETAWAGPLYRSIGTQFVNSSTNAPAVAVPAGVSTDDIITVVIGSVDTMSVTSVPSGFTQAADSPVTGSGIRHVVYWKRQTSATGSGETTGTYNFTLSTTGYTEGVAVRCSNTITSGDPFDVTASATGTASGSFPAVSDTTTVANTLLLLFNMNADAGTAFTTFPAGFTEDLDATAVQSVGHKVQAAAGSTGSLVSTAAAGTGAKIVWLGALKPPAGAATPQGTTSGTYTWAGTAGGAKAPKGTASGAYTWSSSATGVKAPRGTAGGSYTWAATAAGKRPPKGTISGAYTWSSTAAGDAPPNRGTTSGTYTWAGTGTGKRSPAGISSGTYTWSSTATGNRTPKGSAGGAYTWAGSATGSAPTVGANEGTATGTYTWAGSAVGKEPAKGSGSGTYTWSSSATGAKAPKGTGSGTYTWAGSAAGDTPPNRGTASGTYAWSGGVSGVKAPRGNGSGTYTWVGSATGVRPAPGAKYGSGSGAYAWSSTAAGRRSPKATAAGTYGWAGTAFGTTGRSGAAATTTYGWAGAATGSRPAEAFRSGTASGTYQWVGHAFAGILRSGEAAGTYGWRGAAYGWITTLTSDRIIVVAAENRFVVVPSETRWAGIVVAAENRFVVVPSEMRWAGVPKEERTVKAIESRIQVIV